VTPAAGAAVVRIWGSDPVAINDLRQISTSNPPKPAFWLGDIEIDGADGYLCELLDLGRFGFQCFFAQVVSHTLVNASTPAVAVPINVLFTTRSTLNSINAMGRAILGPSITENPTAAPQNGNS
jgi:hypothetical protein